MRTAATRLKNFPLEERLAACGRTVVNDPVSWQGQWASYSKGAPFKRVILDLGCGKGEYTVAVAKLHPEILFVGIDVDGVCVVRSADFANEQGVANAVFIYDRDPQLSAIFAEGELDGILMNFPTPYPNKKRAPLRLTYIDRLLEDRHLLKQTGFIRLRTDGQPLRDFSLTQLELAGYDVVWTSDNVREKFPQEPWSGYERKLTEKGALVCGFEAVPQKGAIPSPESIEQTAALSLVSYLPEDLEHMAYVPYGMEGCVTNLINYRKHCAKKGIPAKMPARV